MSNRLYLCAIFCVIFAANFANAEEAHNHEHHSGADAPVGVMGTHLHKAGEFMLGYAYEYSHATGNRDGSSNVSNASVLAAYGEAATQMDMGMHMFELMYGVTDNLSLMLMPQYMQMDMVHRSAHGGGHMHGHKVKGFGDTELTALYSIYEGMNDGAMLRAHLNFGASLPTGSIDKKFVDHHSNTYNLPYNMQFGSGTVDPIIGATIVAAYPEFSLGAQTINYIRVGKNSNGYRQGNKYGLTTWAAYEYNDAVELSFRVDAEAWGNVHGRDASLPINAIAGANPDEIGGERVMANIGISLLTGEAEGVLAGQRLAAEFGVPIYERFEGPQPDSDFRFTLGWQSSF